MKNLLKIQVLLIATLFFFIGSIDAQTYTPDVSKGKTAIWDYGYGTFGGDFTAFKKTNFKANIVSYSTTWHGIHQNTSGRGISPAHGMVWEPGQVVMHSGNSGAHLAKIKFTAPSDGTYEISAKWTNLQACARKTWAWIYTNAPDAGGKFYNGSPRGYNNIFTQGAQGQNKSVSHKQTFKMTKGQVITFEVGNGGDGWTCDSMGAEIEVKKKSGGSSLKVGTKHLGGTIISLSGRGGVIVSDEIKDVCITNVNQKVGALGRGWASPKIEDLESMAKALPASSFSGEYMSVSHKGSNYYWGYNMTGKRRTAVHTNDCKKVTRAVKSF